jgi:hypothetical protein
MSSDYIKVSKKIKEYMFPYAHDKEDRAIIRLIMSDGCLNCYYMTPTVLV